MQTNVQVPKNKVVEHNTPPPTHAPAHTKMCMPASMNAASAQTEMCNACPMPGKTVKHTTGTPKKYYCE